jgi:hypothetical protein
MTDAHASIGDNDSVAIGVGPGIMASISPSNAILSSSSSSGGEGGDAHANDQGGAAGITFHESTSITNIAMASPSNSMNATMNLNMVMTPTATSSPTASTISVASTSSAVGIGARLSIDIGEHKNDHSAPPSESLSGDKKAVSFGNHFVLLATIHLIYSFYHSFFPILSLSRIHVD